MLLDSSLLSSPAVICLTSLWCPSAPAFLPAEPSCASYAKTATNNQGSAVTTATVALQGKRVGTFKVGTYLPDVFPGETVVVVPLSSAVRQAAATRRGAKLCFSFTGTCDRLDELLGVARGEAPEDAWEAALLDEDTQWWVANIHLYHSCAYSRR